jgi:hypothetical protein
MVGAEPAGPSPQDMTRPASATGDVRRMLREAVHALRSKRSMGGAGTGGGAHGPWGGAGSGSSPRGSDTSLTPLEGRLREEDAAQVVCGLLSH